MLSLVNGVRGDLSLNLEPRDLIQASRVFLILSADNFRDSREVGTS